MINVKRNAGLVLSESTGSLRLPEDRRETAAASIPDWKLLISGGDRFIRSSDNAIVNRAARESFCTQDSTNPVTSGVIPGTSHLAVVTETSGSANDYSPNVSMETDEFTFFAVLYLPSGGGPDQIVYPATVPTDSSNAPRIGFNTSGAFRVWEGGTSVLASHSDGATSYYDQLVYVMACGSVGKGITLRRNGVQTATGTSSWTGFDDTEFELFEDFGGYIGTLGILGRDLSKTENASELALIDNWMLNKYSIS